MNITLDDGRQELWQWDTGRKVVVDDGSISEVHFSKYSSNRAITRAVTDGKAEIPDFLLQDTHAITVYAYSGSIENGYTKAEKTFNILKKPKPSDYVATAADQAILAKLKADIGDLTSLWTNAKDNLVAAVNEVATSGGADWAQNNPTEKDYVKNRPGGYDVVTPEKIISEYEFLGGTPNNLPIELSEPLIEGRSYRLTLSKNKDYSNPVVDGEAVAEFKPEDGAIYVTLSGLCNIFQPSTYPKEPAVYQGNPNYTFSYLRLVALANTETVKIPDKYISPAFFEIKASSNGHADDDGIFKVTADKSADDVLDALGRGKVPYVNFEDALFLWPTDYGRGAMFISFVPASVSGVTMTAMLIDGENSIGIDRELGSSDLYILKAEQGNFGYWYIDGKLINNWYTKIKENPSRYLILCLYKGTYNVKYEYEGPLFLDTITDTEIVYKRTLEDGNWVGFKLSAVDGSPSKNGFIKGVSKEIILSSSTADSTKKFKITVNDTGTLTAEEVTT